ncbi:MAG: 3-deoxy-7-phosphoheptulonate synthase, partial [Clostridia bacterium]|nr:3-deoxy-7-phosphoheptulonate synthase [Clostridia bacterium]
MSMTFHHKLPIPKEIKEQFPVTEKMQKIKEVRDEELCKIFTGESDRFLLVIGPCSADRKEPVLDYIGRLRLLEDKVKDKIMIVPRIYTNKPRTTGDGYKGMLHQPDP